MKKIILNIVLIGCLLVVQAACKKEPKATNAISYQENTDTLACKPFTIGCMIIPASDSKGYIINTKEEYENFTEKYKNPFSSCSNSTPPDFTQYTLLGVMGGIAGCKEPLEEYSIVKKEMLCIFNLKITQRGKCKRNNSVNIWCLIPKVGTDNIKFNITHFYDEE